MMPYRTVSSISTPSFLLPTKRCFFLVLQPGIRRNSSNSRTLRLQHVHPLLPSWKMGTPGWWVQSWSSLASPLYVTPQFFLLHVALAGTAASGSSDSSSGGAGEADGFGVAVCCVAWGLRGAGAGRESTCFACGSCAAGVGSGAGVSSTVECMPVVHGGISINSSKVKTRVLQHFQPGRGQSLAVTARQLG